MIARHGTPQVLELTPEELHRAQVAALVRLARAHLDSLVAEARQPVPPPPPAPARDS